MVVDPAGNLVDTDEFNRKMMALQDALEEDPSVGSAISPPLLIAHARQQPFMGLLSLASWLGSFKAQPSRPLPTASSRQNETREVFHPYA